MTLAAMSKPLPLHLPTFRPAPTLRDGVGRTVAYLRLSLTRACGMRCRYCRPEVVAHPADELLTVGELESLALHLVRRFGLRKIRLTGGEPTARRDLLTIVESLARIDGLRELTMTTNGLTLARAARDLRAAGIQRVNVSIDSLDPERFRYLTGVDGLHRVIAGIDAAMAADLAPKLNTVVMRGHNDVEVGELLLFALHRGLEIRFIELMPMGPLASRFDDWYVPGEEVRERLQRVVASWTPLPYHGAAARRHAVRLFDGTSGTVGFVTPMSHHFCGDCHRLRITGDGALYPWLMGPPAGSVREALRPALDSVRLERILGAGLAGKPAHHSSRGYGVMTDIGG